MLVRYAALNPIHCVLCLWMCWNCCCVQKVQALPVAERRSIPTQQLDLSRMPRHIAIIMDGNGRWATQQGKPRMVGHRQGVEGVRQAVRGCVELGIPYLTLYAFSTENWSRSEEEVDSLMHLFAETIQKDLVALIQENVRITFIGAIERLPPSCKRSILNAQRISSKNTGLHLVIAMNYSGRWDITEAAKAIATRVSAGELDPHSIEFETIEQHLSTRQTPDPDLLIRTGGEQRLSNFLLWQMAYTELFFTSLLWPDFTTHHLCQAILAYQRRDRRFGSVAAAQKT